MSRCHPYRAFIFCSFPPAGERLNPTDGEEVLVSVELEKRHLCGHRLCHPICVSEAIFSDPKAQALPISIPECGYQTHRGNFKSVIGLIILVAVLVGLYVASRKKVSACIFFSFEKNCQ